MQKFFLHESTQQHIQEFQFFYLFIIYSQISEIREIFEKNKDTSNLTIRGVQTSSLSWKLILKLSCSGATKI